MLAREFGLNRRTVTKRYERGSIIVTSNRGFADWGQIFNEVVVATAIVDDDELVIGRGRVQREHDVAA